jgi:hypothetical protein
MKNKKLLLLFFSVLFAGAVVAQGSHTVTLSSNQPSELFAHAGTDTALTMSGTLILGDIPAATGGSPPYSYYWMPGANLDNDTLANPVFTHLGSVYSEEFFLRVTDSRQCMAYDSVTVVMLYHGVDEPSGAPVRIYPVPATSYLTVELPVPGGELTITTLDGRLLERHSIGESTVYLALGHLPRGAYLMHWQSGEKRQAVRILLK